MRCYLYPTYPCENWVKNVRNEWKESCKPYFAFCYLRVRPNQLINKEKKGFPFWLYIHYSEKITREYCPENLPHSKQVKYRIRVIDFEPCQDYPFGDDNVHIIEPPEIPTIWFKCDRFEEIKKLNTKGSKKSCKTLSYHDFEHSEGKNLAATLRATILPIRCIRPIVVIQINLYDIQS